MTTCSCQLSITNKRGLHARASASFSSLAASFPCNIRLGRTPEQLYDAKNILEVMMLAAAPGSVLLLYAEGEQAEEAVAALRQLVDSKFGEEPLTEA